MTMKHGNRGGAVPTLNAFDVGDTRATVLAFQLSGDRSNPSVSTSEERSYTLAANAMSDRGQSVMSQSVVRRLTPTECERLQGFPDGWTEGQADSNRYKQMGNAVAVPVVEWIIKRLVETQ
jgi:DNA (cytosine-5)-methyltransferase 1